MIRIKANTARSDSVCTCEKAVHATMAKLGAQKMSAILESFRYRLSSQTSTADARMRDSARTGAVM